MKKLGYILLLLLTINSMAYAQEDRADKLQRIHSIKVAFITDKIRLTPEQSVHFWPVYNVYEKELKNMRKAAKEYDDELKYQEDVLNLRKQYRHEFLKIISEQQLQALYQAERDFKSMLLNKLKEDRTPSTTRGRGRR
jgi:hypothetical protein